MLPNPQHFLKNLSTQPGIYQMLDQHQKVLYVGKAKNLKKRLASYFRAELPERKTAALMQQTVDIQIILTDSDNQALLLEANLIKQHRPRYNVLLRDDKSYPYLYLSTKQEFPRLDFHRGAKSKPGRYYGPYPNAGAVRESLAIIQKLFKVRQCNDTFFSNRTRPCLQYQIARCTAPCVGYVTPEAYAKQVEHTILFLEGQNEIILDELREQMEHASTQLRYEDAAYYRDLIKRFRQLHTTQVITGDKGDVDIIGIAQAQGQAAIAVLFVRAGRLLGNKAFFPNVPADTTPEEVLAAFIPQYYLSPLRGDKVADEIVLNVKLPDKTWIQDALYESLQQRIKISDRKLAIYRQWQSLAQSNAKYALATHLSEKNTVATKLEALQQALELPNPLQRIECFDISHTLGEATVASCVVYGAEGALNKDYRRFNITDITPGDDYAALQQALLRRYTRIKSGDGVLPDLVMIDGGRGQLQQAVDVLEELQISGVELLAIAKGPGRKPGLEQIYMQGREQALKLRADEPALHLLQFIRDEAHRFAITAHRKQRSKKRQHSPLEQVEGIGVKRRQQLLRHFGGWQELSNATPAEIAKVPGISATLAQKIYDALH